MSHTLSNKCRCTACNLTWKHYKRINTILNKHSKPSDEGGIHYKDAYEEMEKYEHELAEEHHNPKFETAKEKEDQLLGWKKVIKKALE